MCDHSLSGQLNDCCQTMGIGEICVGGGWQVDALHGQLHQMQLMLAGGNGRILLPLRQCGCLQAERDSVLVADIGE